MKVRFPPVDWIEPIVRPGIKLPPVQPGDGMGAAASCGGIIPVAGGAAGDITAGVFGGDASAGFSGVAGSGLAGAPATPLATIVAGAAFDAFGVATAPLAIGALAAAWIGGPAAGAFELQASNASAHDVSQSARVLMFTPFICDDRSSTTTRFS
jgi:hypothetical protein